MLQAPQEGVTRVASESAPDRTTTTAPGSTPIAHTFTEAASDEVSLHHGNVPYALTIGRANHGAMYVYRKQPFVKVLKMASGTTPGTLISINKLIPAEPCHGLFVGDRIVLVTFDERIVQVVLVRAWDTRNDDDENKALFNYCFYDPGTTQIEAL